MRAITRSAGSAIARHVTLLILDRAALGTAADSLQRPLVSLLRHATFRRRAACGAARALFELYGLPAREELPAAAVTRQLDAADAGKGHWLRADPVHLAAGGKLMLTAHGNLGVSDTERKALAEALSQCAAEHGLAFSAPTADRWYLYSDTPFRVRTTPPDELLQRDVAHAEPRSADAAFWRRLLSEMQILLHQHPVNRSRRRQGAIAVNSVWFWGAGGLPAPGPSPFRVVHGGCALARGLQEISDPAPRPGHELMVLDESLGGEAASRALEGVSRIRVLAPSAGWEANRCPWHRVRLWRRPRAAERWLMPGAGGRSV